jgi:hypothetical protein
MRGCGRRSQSRLGFPRASQRSGLHCWNTAVESTVNKIAKQGEQKELAMPAQTEAGLGDRVVKALGGRIHLPGHITAQSQTHSPYQRETNNSRHSRVGLCATRQQAPGPMGLTPTQVHMQTHTDRHTNTDTQTFTLRRATRGPRWGRACRRSSHCWRPCRQADRGRERG